MRYIVLTVDYEIFGNGTDDVRSTASDPDEHMARTLARHGAPLTLFVEMEEFAGLSVAADKAILCTTASLCKVSP